MLSPSAGLNRAGGGGQFGDIINVNGNFTIASGSGAHLQMNVGRSDPGVGSGFNDDFSDRLVVSGSISLSGDLQISLLNNTGYTLQAGDIL